MTFYTTFIFSFLCRKRSRQWASATIRTLCPTIPPLWWRMNCGWWWSCSVVVSPVMLKEIFPLTWLALGKLLSSPWLWIDCLCHTFLVLSQMGSGLNMNLMFGLTREPFGIFWPSSRLCCFCCLAVLGQEFMFCIFLITLYLFNSEDRSKALHATLLVRSGREV